MTVNNEYQAYLMQHPSPPDPHRLCAVCGKPATNLHHIVPRSQGGTDGPVIRLCGSGTTGCHGMAENKQLHFRFVQFTTDPSVGVWEYIKTMKPMKYEDALDISLWWHPLWADYDKEVL